MSKKLSQVFSDLKIPGTIFCSYPFQILKRSILTNLKIPGTIFFLYNFQILRIFKAPLFIPISIYIKTIIQMIFIKIVIQINEHKPKDIITACIPIIIMKKVLLFFFTVYKNERKEHKF